MKKRYLFLLGFIALFFFQKYIMFLSPLMVFAFMVIAAPIIFILWIVSFVIKKIRLSLVY